jgi:cupin 2 domain-containing protein
VSERVSRGRLETASSAPPAGERAVDLATLGGGVRIEQILSGRLEGPADYLQQHDEWVVVLEGRARLVVEGEALELGAGEWLLIPSGCPHTLAGTAPGTVWLAVHAAADG